MVNVMILKHFLGQAIIFGNHHRGISDYCFVKSQSNQPLVVLRGTFTLSELKSLVDAAERGDTQFELPETIKPS